MKDTKFWKIIAPLGETENLPVSLLPVFGDRKDYYRVVCTGCEKEAYRTEKEIRKNSVKCSCSTKRKPSIYLTCSGMTLTLSDWSKLYNISLNSIRARYQQRKTKYPEWTDAQVIFGEEGDFGEPSVGVEEMQERLVDSLGRSTDRMIRKFIKDSVAPAMQQIATFSDSYRDIDELIAKGIVGANYKVQIMDITLSELIRTTGVEEAERFLELEVFKDKEDKEKRLLPFIPMLDIDSMTMQKGEIMQLTSIFTS